MERAPRQADRGEPRTEGGHGIRGLLFGLIFLSPPFLKRILLRRFCGARFGRGAHIGWFSAVVGRQVSIGEHSAVRPFTLVRLAGDLQMGSYSEISSFNLIYGSASLILGDRSYIGPQCLINVDEDVELGSESALGPRSMVFTHGSYLPYTEGYWAKLGRVRLGDRVWCAAGVFIQPGIEIGDDVFVNSRSVVTQNIPAGSVVEGNPAQVVRSMERVRREMTPRRVDAALEKVLTDFADIGLRRELGLDGVEETKGALRFRWSGRDYEIRLIASTGGESGESPVSGRAERLYVSNRPGWSPPGDGRVFDVPAMRTQFVPDRIHTELRLFMQRYYGMRFEDREPGASEG